MSGLDLVKFGGAVKSRYTRDRVRDLTFKNNPAYAMIAKFTDWDGSDLPVPLIYGNPQGRSATFLQAKTRGNLTGVETEGFKLTRVRNYSVATIDNEAVLAAKKDTGAFVEAKTATLDGAWQTLANDYAFDLFRSGWGARGRIAAINSDEITLENLDDVRHFERNMEFVLSSSENAAVLRDSGDSLTIATVDRSNGKFKASAAISGIAGATVGDYIFIKGDRENSATPKRLKIAGFQAWIPDAAPDATLFFGVDRSKDTDRLGGLRGDFSNMPLEEALIDIATIIDLAGGNMTHGFVHPRKAGALKKSLGSKVQLVDVEVTPRISFRGIELATNGGSGVAKIFGDRNCQFDRCWGMQLDTWRFDSLGEPCRTLDTDGNEWLRQNDEDGIEVRLGGYVNVENRAPGWNMNAKI